jgi:hypothetical protein
VVGPASKAARRRCVGGVGLSHCNWAIAGLGNQEERGTEWLVEPAPERLLAGTPSPPRQLMTIWLTTTSESQGCIAAAAACSDCFNFSLQQHWNG